MSGGHLLAGGLYGGNTIVLPKVKMQIKSRLAHQKNTSVRMCFLLFTEAEWDVTHLDADI
jgi:hypothetical protein